MPKANAGNSRPIARINRNPSTAYSVTCAHLRRISSQVPRPVESTGIDESAKITPAQTTTGPQSASRRERGIEGP